jgi:citrate lyase beta subunit
MKQSLTPDDLNEPLKRLHDANREVAAIYPGESGLRQPVHTVYGGAHLFRFNTAPRLGKAALSALDAWAGSAAEFAAAIGLTREDLAGTIYSRVVQKLSREPVEDFRIDFEDGYGNRPDAEEDGHAESAAREVAQGLAAGSLPPFIGIRMKPLTEELKLRSLRTVDIFLTTLLDATGGRLPDGFIITLPKITTPAQPAALADVLDRLEPRLGVPAGSLQFELMIETTQSILDDNGRSGLLAQVQAGRGRVNGAHFGTYDYTASCSITASWQSMTHPACDFARHMMQVALAGTGIRLSDGATNILPVPIHRAPEGRELYAGEVADNRRAVQAAWRLHYDHVRHSLTNAYYQGWDLHPAQLPTRYAAVYSFFLEGLEPAADRLRNFVGKAAQATLAGEVFDDAATGQGLLNYFLRAINCGAVTEEEAATMTGITNEELRSRSFVKILGNRRG